MGSSETGELFTQEEVDVMVPQQRAELDLVKITPAVAKVLEPMSLGERKQYLKSQKHKSRKTRNNRERQNKRNGRR